MEQQEIEEFAASLIQFHTRKWLLRRLCQTRKAGGESSSEGAHRPKKEIQKPGYKSPSSLVMRLRMSQRKQVESEEWLEREDICILQKCDMTYLLHWSQATLLVLTEAYERACIVWEHSLMVTQLRSDYESIVTVAVNEPQERKSLIAEERQERERLASLCKTDLAWVEWYVNFTIKSKLLVQEESNVRLEMEVSFLVISNILGREIAHRISIEYEEKDTWRYITQCAIYYGVLPDLPLILSQGLSVIAVEKIRRVLLQEQFERTLIALRESAAWEYIDAFGLQLPRRIAMAEFVLKLRQDDLTTDETVALAHRLVEKAGMSSTLPSPSKKVAGTAYVHKFHSKHHRVIINVSVLQSEESARRLELQSEEWKERSSLLIHSHIGKVHPDIVLSATNQYNRRLNGPLAAMLKEAEKEAASAARNKSSAAHPSILSADASTKTSLYSIAYPFSVTDNSLFPRSETVTTGKVSDFSETSQRTSLVSHTSESLIAISPCTEPTVAPTGKPSQVPASAASHPTEVTAIATVSQPQGHSVELYRRKPSEHSVIVELVSEPEVRKPSVSQSSRKASAADVAPPVSSQPEQLTPAPKPTTPSYERRVSTQSTQTSFKKRPSVAATATEVFTTTPTIHHSSDTLDSSTEPKPEPAESTAGPPVASPTYPTDISEIRVVSDDAASSPTQLSAENALKANKAALLALETAEKEERRALNWSEKEIRTAIQNEWKDGLDNLAAEKAYEEYFTQNVKAIQAYCRSAISKSVNQRIKRQRAEAAAKAAAEAAAKVEAAAKAQAEAEAAAKGAVDEEGLKAQQQDHEVRGASARTGTPTSASYSVTSAVTTTASVTSSSIITPTSSLPGDSRYEPGADVKLHAPGGVLLHTRKSQNGSSIVEPHTTSTDNVSSEASDLISMSNVEPVLTQRNSILAKVESNMDFSSIEDSHTVASTVASSEVSSDTQPSQNSQLPGVGSQTLSQRHPSDSHSVRRSPSQQTSEEQSKTIASTTSSSTATGGFQSKIEGQSIVAKPQTPPVEASRFTSTQAAVLLELVSPKNPNALDVIYFVPLMELEQLRRGVDIVQPEARTWRSLTAKFDQELLTYIAAAARASQAVVDSQVRKTVGFSSRPSSREAKEKPVVDTALEETSALDGSIPVSPPSPSANVSPQPRPVSVHELTNNIRNIIRRASSNNNLLDNPEALVSELIEVAKQAPAPLDMTLDSILSEAKKPAFIVPLCDALLSAMDSIFEQLPTM